MNNSLDNLPDSTQNELPWPLRSRVIVKNYRLSAQDLLSSQATERNSFRTQIVNVSLEGVEELNVLLHLEGISKPLQLTKEQLAQTAAMFQSNNYTDWIGRSLALTVSKSSARRADRQAAGTDIELSLVADQAATPSPTGTGSPQRTNAPHSAMDPHSDASNTADTASAAAQEQSPDSLNPSQRRVPHTHFSGAGQEYSMPDPTVEFASARRGGARLSSPRWLQSLGQSALFRQLRLILGPNFWVALLLFLLIVGVVQFERIAALLAFLQP